MSIVEHNQTPQDLKHAVADNRLVGLWRIMKGHRLVYLGAVIFLGIGAAFNTATFWLIRYFIDEILPQGMTGVFALVAGGFLLLALGRGLFTFLSGALAARTAERIAENLRNYLYDHVQHLSFTYHDKMQTGELVQRCTSDIDSIRRFFAEQSIGVGRILLLFIVNFVFLLTLHWQLALVSVIVIPVVFMLSLFFFRRLSKAYEAFQEQEARLSTVLQENLSGVRVVKAFARQSYERDKFEKENVEKFRLGRNFMLMHSGYWPITDIITGFQMLFGFFTGATLAINGEITVGTYMAYASTVIWIIFPMREMGRLIIQMSTGMVSYDRVAEIIREDRVPLGKTESPPLKAVRGAVAFENVSFTYIGDASPVLNDVSFSIESGKTVALLGSTGSGKTSLVSLIPRFYDYQSGSITIDGIELVDFPRHFLRANIGIVEQEPFLFSRTIRENIALGVSRQVSDEEVEAAARAASIHEVIQTFPKGYDTLVGERGVTLSGGQKQRVALARTLLKNPRILILDDATSSVDTETESSIRDALNNLMEGRTTFVIAHRIQSVMTADLILVFDKGRIVERGTHRELMANNGIYRRTYDMQARIETELEEELARVG